MSSPWERAVASIEAKLGPSTMDTWFRHIRFVGIQGNICTLTVPNLYYIDWIRDNYTRLMEEELEKEVGRKLSLSFSTADPLDETPPSDSSSEDSLEFPGHFRLNPSQTFENFVVGPSNQFAHAASLNVSLAPARNYNPLFLFGGVGLGKTHLLNAIGNRIRKASPKSRVVYLSAEEFMNEMINSLRYERMEEFREKYRQRCEVLLVDDIQFLEGKDRTQEEFFHTFNSLHASGRQIAVTSDKKPKDIGGMEERLRTRFEWGLIADIQPPEMETRVAILKKKADAEQIRLPDDVALFIASQISANVRKLEGTLTRLIALSSFHGEALTVDFARRVLSGFADRPSEGPPSIERIQEAVARFFNLKVTDLKGQRRTKIQALPRQIAMYLCRKHSNSSFPEIGDRFGGRDHSTVIHAFRKIESDLLHDEDLHGKISTLERNLLG